MNKRSDTVKFAIIGCGHIGRRHADMIRANGNAELLALCDSKEKSALHLDAYDYPFFNSVDTLLNSNLPFDIVSICTPNGLHAKHALAALHTNRHVLIEKPLALRSEHCRWIIRKAEEKEKKVFCVMQNRYSPPSAWLKELITKNILGKIYMVHIHCFWNRDKRYYTGDTWHGKAALDGGTLFTQFSHFIDMLYWLFGEIKNISARFEDFNHHNLTAFEDSGSVSFDIVGGGIGTFNYSTAVHQTNFESSITIIAEKGTVKVGGQYMDKISYCEIADYEMPEMPVTNAANDYGTHKGSAANHHSIIENIVDVFQHQAPIATTAREGMKVVEIIESIYALRPAGLLKNLN